MSFGFEELSEEQCRYSSQCHSFDLKVEITRSKYPEGERAMMAYDYPHPVSRTYQYKKITKPLLERKRRARINACLDELKDLMVDALETEGENINKLEKADILELTVRHLQRLQAARPSGLSVTTTTTTTTTTSSTASPTNDEVSAESRWQSGFGHCAAEACRFLSALPGEAAERLARHLAAGLQMHRRPDSTTNPGLLTPTLSNLEQTANAVSPSPVSSTTETNTTTSSRPSAKRATPYPERNGEKVCDTSSISPPLPTPPTPITAERLELNFQRKKKDDRNSSLVTGKNKTSDVSRTSEDEEEIDVERVDEGDPMWRPW